METTMSLTFVIIAICTVLVSILIGMVLAGAFAKLGDVRVLKNDLGEHRIEILRRALWSDGLVWELLYYSNLEDEAEVKKFNEELSIARKTGEEMRRQINYRNVTKHFPS